MYTGTHQKGTDVFFYDVEMFSSMMLKLCEAAQ
jgi:hypothetical protein